MPADHLAIGALILVKPGDGAPADGIVVSGASRLDESMLTGEAAPVSKKADDKVRHNADRQNSIKYSAPAQSVTINWKLQCKQQGINASFCF